MGLGKVTGLGRKCLCWTNGHFVTQRMSEEHYVYCQLLSQAHLYLIPGPGSSPSHFTLIPTLLQFIWKHSLVYQLYQLKDKLLWFFLQSTNGSRCLSILWKGFHPSIPAGTPSPRTQSISPSHSSASKVWEDLLPNPPSPGLALSVKDQVLKLYASLYQQPIF